MAIIHLRIKVVPVLKSKDLSLILTFNPHKGRLMFLLVLLLGSLLYFNAELIPRYQSEPIEFSTLSHRLEQVYFLGKSYLLQPWEKRYFRALTILHLFTPSGLHFTSLLLPIRLLLKKFKLKYRYTFVIKLIIILPFCFLENFHSMRRVAIFAVLFLLQSKPNQNIHRGLPSKTVPETNKLMHLFLATFLIDFINGSYSTSPLSFTYSFLFWGSILAGLNGPKWKVFSNLFIAQALMCFYQEENFWPLGFLFGQIITMLYSLIFPILATIEAACSKVIFLNEIHIALYAFAKWQYSLPALTIYLPIISILLTRKRFILFLIGIAYSSPCFNLPTNESQPHSKYFLSQNFLKHKRKEDVFYTPRKTLIKTKENDICYAKLKNTVWVLKCKSED